MRLKQVRKLTFTQWYWLLHAYFRLCYVRARLKFGSAQWLSRQLSLVDSSNISSREKSELRHKSVEQTDDKDKEVESHSIDSSELISLAKAEQVHESVRLAARLHLLPMQCLPRSIVLTNMLVSLGMPAKMFIGVRKGLGKEVDKGIESHAWVELHGHLLVEPATVEQDFTRLKT